MRPRVWSSAPSWGWRLTSTARGTFEAQIRPGTPEPDGAVARFGLSKTFSGDLAVSPSSTLEQDLPPAG